MVVESMDFCDTSDSTIYRKNNRSIFHKAHIMRSIIIIETIVIIILLLFYLTNNNHLIPTTFQQQENQQLDKQNTTNTYLVYSNGKSSSKFLIDLATGCNLRKHDLKYGIKCDSRNITKCNINNQAISLPNNNYETTQYYNFNENQKIKSKRKKRQISFDNSPSIGQVVTQITTSKVGQRFDIKHVQMKRIDCLANDCKFKTKLTIYVNERQQEILGWGGALSDSSINNILSLTTNGTKQLLDDYFSKDGLMFNMIRITIGGSDFSSRFYTNDDNDSNKNKNINENENDDVELKKFKLREEDILYKIPIIKEIQANYYDNNSSRQKLKLFASMWSPPKWMKTNNYHNKGQIKGFIDPNTNQQTIDEIYYKALAILKKKFILAYLEEGIKFWGLTILNEPIMANAEFLDFNSLIFSDQDYANYITKYLGPLIKSDEKLKDLKLIAHDDNRKFLTNFTTPILRRKEVKKYIDGVSTHGYIDEEYHLMQELYDEHHLKDKNFFILPTELCSGHLPWMEKALIGNWDRGIHYALDIIHGLQHSAAGWVDWNMVLDTSGGPGWLGGRLDSPVIVDKINDVYYKSPMFYVLGQFSRYIPPGSFKLKSLILNTNYDYQFETASFISPDGKEIITVVLNNNPYEIKININLINNQATDTQVFHQVVCQADSITTFIINNTQF